MRLAGLLTTVSIALRVIVDYTTAMNDVIIIVIVILLSTDCTVLEWSIIFTEIIVKNRRKSLRKGHVVVLNAQ